MYMLYSVHALCGVLHVVSVVCYVMCVVCMCGIRDVEMCVWNVSHICGARVIQIWLSE